MSNFDDYQHIKVSRDGHVAVATLNRPERLNAVNPRMQWELTRLLPDLNDDDDIRSVVLTGEGRAFCAGGDVQAMAEGAERIDRFAQVRPHGVTLIENILNFEKPLISMVNGPAIGLGATLALLCDIVIASDRARIGDPHVSVGLVAGDGGHLIWPALVGINRAKEFLMLGELLEGPRLYELGLVNHIVPEDQLRGFTMDLARRLAERSPYACKATKLVLNQAMKQSAVTSLHLGLSVELLSQTKLDHREAATAFLEKRAPVFRGE